VRNRKLEICTSGSVRGEGGNILTYSAKSSPLCPIERTSMGRAGTSLMGHKRL
jgi:hypothetical protein